MSINEIAQLSPPWYTYHRKITALFGPDPEVTIKDLAKTDNGYNYMVLVSNKQKAKAIKVLLPEQIEISNSIITSNVYGPDENEINTINENIDYFEIIRDAFSGNPIFSRVEIKKFSGSQYIYCIFAKQVIQFWNDDLSDYFGNYNGLAEDIALEVFVNAKVQFCTEIN